jgi:hypothetical protein
VQSDEACVDSHYHGILDWRPQEEGALTGGLIGGRWMATIVAVARKSVQYFFRTKHNNGFGYWQDESSMQTHSTG